MIRHAFLAFCLVPCLTWAQGGTQTAGKAPGSTASSWWPAAVSSRRLCAPGDRTVFSCVLDGNGKIVSLCATNSLNRFYYAYGRPGVPEFVFPSNNKISANPFMRTSLYFSGERGGYAYSFVEKDFRHTLYSISGSYGSKISGLIVRRISGGRPVVQDMVCRKSSTFEWNEQAVLDVMLKWPSDTDLAADGLPGVH